MLGRQASIHELPRRRVLGNSEAEGHEKGPGCREPWRKESRAGVARRGKISSSARLSSGPLVLGMREDMGTATTPIIRNYGYRAATNERIVKKTSSRTVEFPTGGVARFWQAAFFSETQRSPGPILSARGRRGLTL